MPFYLKASIERFIKIYCGVGNCMDLISVLFLK